MKHAVNLLPVLQAVSYARGAEVPRATGPALERTNLVAVDICQPKSG